MPSHWSSPELHIVTGSSPTGTQFVQAAGCAHASSYVNPGTDEVTLVCTGRSSATSEGEFWECMNAACLEKLPLLVLVEDNGFAISVPVEAQTAGGSISALLRSFPDQFIAQCDGEKRISLNPSRRCQRILFVACSVRLVGRSWFRAGCTVLASIASINEQVGCGDARYVGREKNAKARRSSRRLRGAGAEIANPLSSTSTSSGSFSRRAAFMHSQNSPSLVARLRPLQSPCHFVSARVHVAGWRGRSLQPGRTAFPSAKNP